jgi:pimeloyl-ACP methyl ester carboxylesterase
VADGFEQELLRAWWERAAAVDERVVPPDAEVLSRSPRWAQRALFALSNSRYFAAAGDSVLSLLVGDLKQVSGYLTDDRVRRDVLDAVAGAVTADTRVVVGHSLGSVVAYEALREHPEWPVRALVTLGSPLGLRLVYDRLRPPRGAWPGPVTAWTNLADSGDVVAVVEDLRPLFGPGVRQVRVHNGSSAHDLRPYLTERLTGTAIAAGMRG